MAHQANTAHDSRRLTPNRWVGCKPWVPTSCPLCNEAEHHLADATELPSKYLPGVLLTPGSFALRPRVGRKGPLVTITATRWSTEDQPATRRAQVDAPSRRVCETRSSRGGGDVLRRPRSSRRDGPGSAGDGPDRLERHWAGRRQECSPPTTGQHWRCRRRPLPRRRVTRTDIQPDVPLGRRREIRHSCPVLAGHHHRNDHRPKCAVDGTERVGTCGVGLALLPVITDLEPTWDATLAISPPADSVARRSPCLRCGEPRAEAPPPGSGRSRSTARWSPRARRGRRTGRRNRDRRASGSR